MRAGRQGTWLAGQASAEASRIRAQEERNVPTMSKILGIDLGTTNSAMAVLEGGQPTIIVNAEAEHRLLHQALHGPQVL
mgnify:CR=1 FL=1